MTVHWVFFPRSKTEKFHLLSLTCKRHPLIPIDVSVDKVSVLMLLRSMHSWNFILLVQRCWLSPKHEFIWAFIGPVIVIEVVRIFASSLRIPSFTINMQKRKLYLPSSCPNSQQKLTNLDFRARISALWLTEQSAKFDSAVIRQDLWILATVHDWEPCLTGGLSTERALRKGKH